MEEEEVEIVVALGEEVAQHSGRVATADLIGRQAEVDALHEVPQLGHRVQTETPEKPQGHLRHDEKNAQKHIMKTTRAFAEESHQ